MACRWVDPALSGGSTDQRSGRGKIIVSLDHRVYTFGVKVVRKQLVSLNDSSGSIYFCPVPPASSDGIVGLQNTR